MTKKPLTYEEFKSIYSKVPRLTVEVIIKTDEGILFTKRAIPPYVGSWHFPGGTVYYKETITDAVKRVAKDELGVEVEIEKFIGFLHYPNLVQDEGWDWPIGAAHLVKILKGVPKGSEQGREIRFFNKLPENMVPAQGEFLSKHGLI